MMHDDLDRAHEPLPAKVGAEVRFEIRRAAVRYEEADERLQPQERLLGGAQQTKRQPKPVETDSPALVQSLHVAHRDDRVPANSRRVMTLERDRLLPAQDIDRIVLLQIADQREILNKNPMLRRVPARIDDEDVKAEALARSGSAAR